MRRAAGTSKFEMTVAGSCSEARTCHLEADGFDCVILDLELADGDGVDVCRADGGSGLFRRPDHHQRHRLALLFGGPRLCQVARDCGAGLVELVRSVLAPVRLANLSQDIQGLPAIHDWGGASVG